MSDLVKRLRGHAHWGMTEEAADRIEELEAVLRHIAKNWPESAAAKNARAALNKKG